MTNTDMNTVSERINEMREKGQREIEDMKARHEADKKEREKERTEKLRRRSDIETTYMLQIQAVELQRDLLYIDIEHSNDREQNNIRFEKIAKMNETIAKWHADKIEKMYN